VETERLAQYQHILLRLQRWLPKSTKLAHQVHEMAVESDVTTVGELKRMVAEQYLGGDCPTASVWLLKPFGFQMKDSASIPRLWVEKPQPKDEGLVTSGALNATAGALLLFKDEREPEQVEVPPIVEATSGSTEIGGALGPRAARAEGAGFRIFDPSEQREEEAAGMNRRVLHVGRAAAEAEFARLPQTTSSMARTNSI
jgi:hypothetical protein